MLKSQVSMLNECSDSQCINALNHYFIDSSLNFEHCVLNINYKGVK